MRGPYSDYAAPPIYVYRDAPKGIRFSRTELVQLTIAILALSAALTLLNVLSSSRSGVSVDTLALLTGLYFAAAVVAVGTGVGLHEIAHKVVAQRYGHWAEFRYYPMGLLLAFVFAFLGFIYGAPGATMVSGNVTNEEHGRISAAGPATNLVIAAAFLGLATLFGDVIGLESLALLVVWLVVTRAAFINLILAGFNMIPVLPLDGAKVWAWNKGIYFAIIGLVVVLFATGYFGGLF